MIWQEESTNWRLFRPLRRVVSRPVVLFYLCGPVRLVSVATTRNCVGKRLPVNTCQTNNRKAQDVPRREQRRSRHGHPLEPRGAKGALEVVCVRIRELDDDAYQVRASTQRVAASRTRTPRRRNAAQPRPPQHHTSHSRGGDTDGRKVHRRSKNIIINLAVPVPSRSCSSGMYCLQFVCVSGADSLEHGRSAHFRL